MTEELTTTTTEAIATMPNLAGVITSDDVSKKGTGSYSADYINWARVAHILHDHAPGWQFAIRLAPDGGYIWRAPNGTGFMVGYFISPSGEVAVDFPQAVMDNRNNPVPYDRITARDVTDTHRRALCAAACFTFGLAWELWAKEAIEDPHKREPAPQPPATPQRNGNLATEAQLKRLWAVTKEHGVSADRAKEILAAFGFESSKEITKAKYDEIIAAIQADNQK